MVRVVKTPKVLSSSSTKSTLVTARWSGFDLEILDARPGFLLMRVSGKKAKQAFCHEGGGHRFQRVPPNEKRGRVHTSTITVAVLDAPTEHEVHIDPRDLEESFTRGSGPGGQHRNKTDSCVNLLHIPSGIKVRVDGGRSQTINRQTALGILRARLKDAGDTRLTKERNASRKRQVGKGSRADKVRTIAIQRDIVTDHNTGKTMKAKQYLRGNLKMLW